MDFLYSLKKRVCVIISFLICCIFCAPSFAQTNSTQGRDFWFAFMQNYTATATTSLIISAERACTGTISNPYTGWSTSFTISSNGRIDVSIPYAQCYVTSYGSVVNAGCHIVATDIISVYAMNYYANTFDGSNILPTPTLGDEYVLQTYPGNLYGSEFMILATEDNTIVDITPTSATSNSWYIGSTYSITLNAGQCYQVKSSYETGDFSGTRCAARDCKRIVVYAGNVCNNVPTGCTACDHIYEQMIPIVYWGKNFVLTSTYGRQDRVRITALNNGTTVRKNGSLVTTLSGGSTYEFELSTNSSCYIETSGPSLACIYLIGQTCASSDGDPSMVIINPIEQNINRIIFGTYGFESAIQYVNVVIPTTSVGSAQLDGSNISSSLFSPVTGNSSYSFARMQISHATHTLSCEEGLIAHVYGLSWCTSYAYSVGSSAIDLTRQLYINDVNIADIPEDRLYCPNIPIDFSLEVNYDYTSMQWLFGDGETAMGNPVSHTYPTSGQYPVTVIITRPTFNCWDDVVDTVTATVNVPPDVPIPIYKTICQGSSYDFRGRILSEEGIYLDTIHTGSLCDSILELHLTIAPTDPIPTYVSVCQGQTYDFLGRELSEDGIYMDTVVTAEGCDSIIELHFSIIPPDPIPQYVAVCQGLTYDFLGRELFEPGIYYDTVATEAGCDSIIELHFSIVPTDPIPIYVTICPGETYTLDGVTYSNPGVYYDSLTTELGCDSIMELHLSFASVPDISLGNDKTLCSPNDLPVVLSVSGAVDNLTYQWNTGETTSSIVINDAGTYQLTVSNQYNCRDSDDIQVIVKDELYVEIEQIDDFCEGGVTTLIAHTNAPHVQWFHGAITPEIEVTSAGTYRVRVYDGPCSKTADLLIPGCPFNLYFPNCITPSDNDGINDVFGLSNPSLVDEIEVDIFDRWGLVSFHSNDPYFSWDGKVNGKIPANNVFSWRIVVKPKLEKRRYIYKGTLLVL